MKKWILILLAIALLFFISSYIFIPGKLIISKVTPMNSTAAAANRNLSDESAWRKWWPEGFNTSNSKFFSYNGCNYKLSGNLYNLGHIHIIDGDKFLNSTIVIIPLPPDSIIVHWQTTMNTSLNPFKRIFQYLQAKHIKSNMASILDHLSYYLENKKKVYGYDIEHTTLRDTVVMATKTITRSYPSTEVIYNLIDKVQTYMEQQGASQTDFPMLNITKKDSTEYEVMIGLPSNKELLGNNTIFPKHLVPIKDKILTAEIKGGPASVQEGFHAIETYMADHHLTAPVIPFVYLVTDRSKERDSTKWITRIYYPII